jgi:pyruvate kinase
MIQSGMNVARLNFSHGTQGQHAEVIKTIRGYSAVLDIPIAILIDLPGPKPRTGRLKEKRVYIKEGDNFSLTSERVLGDEHRISVDSPAFLNDIRAGDSIFLNDGAIQLKVLSTTNIEVNCKVVTGGLLSDNKGINVPGVKLNVSSITSEDLKHLTFAVEQGVDFVAISFVRSVDDVLEIKKILQKKRSNIQIIAKIEKPEGVNDIDKIIAEVDGIMIARGDLGIEIPLKRVPIVQKDIIRKCNQAGKPVIVATQMLESMIGATRPTRAEVSDVANAIFDLTDAVMLSGETAVGKYPVRAVKMMVSIITETEKILPYKRILREKSEQVTAQTDDAISYAACHISQQLRASCIVAYTSTGSTALRVSKYRSEVPILAITPNARIVRSLALSWGIEPHLATEPSNVDLMFQKAAQLALQNGIAKRGELVIITAGIPMGIPGSTNVVKVHRVG